MDIDAIHTATSCFLSASKVVSTDGTRPPAEGWNCLYVLRLFSSSAKCFLICLPLSIEPEIKVKMPCHYVKYRFGRVQTSEVKKKKKH